MTSSIGPWGLPSELDRNHVFIGGRWVESAGDEWLDVVDPTTEAVAARVRAGNEADVDRAVAEARVSFDAGVWRNRPVEERAAVMEELADRIVARTEEIASLVTLELGAPRSGTDYNAVGVAAQIRGVAEHLRAVPLSEDRPRRDGGTGRVLREPTGVVGAITAFNGALLQLSWKLVPALAAGCSVVLKTAAETPLGVSVVADVLGELVAEGRIDPGVVSILASGAGPAQHLVAHPEVDHVTFTGSSAVGRQIMRTASDRVAKVTLELGGKSAAVVLDDADFGSLMQSLPLGGCGHTGQMCIALTRVLVPHSRRQELVEAYRDALSTVVVGNPWDPATVLGPFGTGTQRDRVAGHVDRAVTDGAKLVTGGRAPAHLERGFFYEPTLLDGVDNSAPIARDEVFGPVVVVIGYDDVDEAVRIANDSRYGLAASVYSGDAERAYDVARRIRSGTVAINSAGMDTTLPFGGYKQSGIGREKGVAGMEEFMESKTFGTVVA